MNFYSKKIENHKINHLNFSINLIDKEILKISQFLTQSKYIKSYDIIFETYDGLNFVDS